MLDYLLHRIRPLAARTISTSEFLADSLYGRAERTTISEAADDRVARIGRGRIIGRLFGLIWLVYIISAFSQLQREHLPLHAAILAWIALVLFTLAYVLLIVFATPMWATADPRDQWFNRTMIGTQGACVMALVVLLPHWELGFVFIYCSVSAGMFLTRREGIRVIAAVTIVSMLTSVYEGSSIADTLTAALLVGGIGMNSLFWSALMAQNRALRQARAEITRLAISEERLRIARDLHDLLGHNLSIIALKSELAGRLLDSHPERAASEIADVQQVARTALQEVREAVAGYRMASLAGEIEHSTQMLQAAGVYLSFQIDADTLPTDLDRALAWFVREGTTNIIRHADTASATLRINRHGDRIFAEYIDNGGASAPNHTSAPPTPPGHRSAAGGGFGLIGLGERMRALGGEFSAGPMPERGFRLYVTLPLGAPHPRLDSIPAMPPPETHTSLEPAR